MQQLFWVAAGVVVATVLGGWIVQRAARRATQASFDARIERLERELRQAVDASTDRAVV